MHNSLSMRDSWRCDRGASAFWRAISQEVRIVPLEAAIRAFCRATQPKDEDDIE